MRGNDVDARNLATRAHHGPRGASIRQGQDSGVTSFNMTSERRLHLVKRTS
jgi:hypothetical protein